MEGILLKEVLMITQYGNREVSDWINRTYAGKGFEREAAFATVKFLAEKYPDINKTLNVTTFIEEKEKVREDSHGAM